MPQDAPQEAPKPAVGVLARLRAWIDGHEFLKNVLTLMSGTTIAQVLAFVAQIFTARLYTPAEVGVYGLVMAVVGGLSTLASLRYDLAIVLPESPADARGLVRLATILNTSICAVATVLLIVLAGPISSFAHSPRLAGWLWTAGPLSWFYSQVMVRNYWCNRTKQYGVMSRNRIAQSLITTTTQVGMGLPRWGVLGLVGSTLLGQGFAAVNLMMRTRTDLNGGPRSPIRPLMREYAKMPLLNGPNALVDAVRINAIPFLIGRYFGEILVGHFNKAWQLMQAPVALINGALSQVFYQKLSVTRRGHMFSVVWRGIMRSALIGVVPFALLYAFSPALFPWLLGHQWDVTGYVARSLVPWLFMNFITSPVSLLFVVARRQEVMLAFSIVFMAVPLALLTLARTPDMAGTMTLVSWAMAGMLGVFLVLALVVARQFDNGWGADLRDDPDAAPLPL